MKYCRENKFYLSIIFIYLGQLLANESTIINETLNYSISFRFLPAGEAQIDFSSDTLNGYPAFHLKSTLKTNVFIDNFFIIRDEVDIWLDVNDFSLKKVIKNIHEGNYKKYNHTYILNDSTAVFNGKNIFLSDKVYDPIALIYFLRNQNLEFDYNKSILSYDNGKVKQLYIDILGIELINVFPLGKIECIKVAPRTTTKEPLLKNNGEMEVWFTNDNIKLPVKIVQKTNIGNMTMKLKQIINNNF